MSKSVLISINPEWCDLIIRGQKTLEVRKTRPKLETPFTTYIYCTKAPQHLITIFKDSEEIYTNGAELVAVFRVEQALEHYEKEIRNKAIDDFKDELFKNSERVRPVGWLGYSEIVTCEKIYDIAEKLKEGGKE